MEHPLGTQEHRHNGLSVLQQHVAFFDLDDNGIIYPSETFFGFRLLGFNVLASLILATGIHLALSYATLPRYQSVYGGSVLIIIIGSMRDCRALEVLRIILCHLCESSFPSSPSYYQNSETYHPPSTSFNKLLNQLLWLRIRD
ncbi:hypothetical protein Bca52824_035884 [Brassica carinata]|uniref:Uncharacterized protein n=1 Tax=Brassica carinata TaxID=52824 RepID=A0A8X7S485_BRACI|nr:hypothetical protein Bca52824_035884 [Brassica carinata]